MKNIVVDFGNSRIKAGVFESSTLVNSFTFSQPDELHKLITTPHENLIISSVKGEVISLLEASVASNKRIELSPNTPLPITIKYTTPGTLGVDRIADACGAFQLNPNQNNLVIDVGTCINYEFIDHDNNYRGGIISPGVGMRFKSMNNFTAKLPLVEAIGSPELIGNSTIGCLQSGVMNGILEEMNGIISRIEAKYPELRVILTGGDSHFFENQLKHSIFAAPELVLLGLNRILIHNVSN